MKIKNKKHRSGFTLIELVLVLTIISILVGGGIYMLTGNIDIAKETRVEGDIQAIKTQIMVYASRNYRPPTTEQGLRALVEMPDQDPLPERWSQLMEEVPLDPWGREYQYRNPAERSGKEYDIFTFGKDGVESEDDMGNWKRKSAQK